MFAVLNEVMGVFFFRLKQFYLFGDSLSLIGNRPFA